MALPIFAIVVVLGITAVGGVTYQLRMTVESVEEVFTNPDSFINSTGGKAVIGAGLTAAIVLIVTNLMKGMK